MAEEKKLYPVIDAVEPLTGLTGEVHEREEEKDRVSVVHELMREKPEYSPRVTSYSLVFLLISLLGIYNRELICGFNV